MEKKLISSSGGLKNIRIRNERNETISFRIERYEVAGSIEIILKVDDEGRGIKLEIYWNSVKEVENEMIKNIRSILWK